MSHALYLKQRFLDETVEGFVSFDGLTDDIADAITTFNPLHPLDITQYDGLLELKFVDVSPEVPDFTDNWTGKMIKFIDDNQLDADWVSIMLWDLCESWGCPDKSYAVKAVCDHVGYNCSDDYEFRHFFDLD